MEDDLGEKKSFDIKVKINTLLWECLPSKTTLGKAEEIACTTHALILKEYERYCRE